MRSVVCGISLLIVELGCGSHPDEAKSPEPVTRRQRDSVIGASRLPGAKGVHKALAIADSADARRAREDSVAQEP